MVDEAWSGENSVTVKNDSDEYGIRELDWLLLPLKEPNILWV